MMLERKCGSHAHNQRAYMCYTELYRDIDKDVFNFKYKNSETTA